jgi:hypothetical protein
MDRSERTKPSLPFPGRALYPEGQMRDTECLFEFLFFVFKGGTRISKEEGIDPDGVRVRSGSFIA